MSHLPKAAVVILNWNGKKYLEQFLPPLLSNSYTGMELIIADNGSTDDSIAFLESHYPQVRLIRFNENHGFAGGYNRALQQIEADYYILLNSDVEVTAGWLEPMIELLEKEPTIAACQPKLLTWHQKNLFEYAGGAGGWIDSYGYPFAKGRVFDHFEEDHGQYNQPGPLFWASGACLFIRARVFHEVNGFDDYFFAHQEEIDLCWRIQLAGHKIWSCPASLVYHVGGGTLPKGNSLKTFLNFRNNRIMLSKNLPFRKKIWVVPIRYLLDAVSAWKGLLSGDAGYFVAIFRAHLAFIRWWLFHQKKSVFPINRNGRLAGVYKGNIALQHFARKKKTFSEIVGKSN